MNVVTYGDEWGVRLAGRQSLLHPRTDGQGRPEPDETYLVGRCEHAGDVLRPALWFGGGHRLERQEVELLILHLRAWLGGGSLALPPGPAGTPPPPGLTGWERERAGYVTGLFAANDRCRKCGARPSDGPGAGDA